VAKDHQVGDTVRVKLYSGEIVTAKIAATFWETAGRKVQIVFGDRVAKIDPGQILKPNQ
jgi:hypothetical protein